MYFITTHIVNIVNIISSLFKMWKMYASLEIILSKLIIFYIDIFPNNGININWIFKPNYKFSEKRPIASLGTKTYTFLK